MRAWLLAGCCLAWLFVALPVAQAQEKPVTLEEYWALIDHSLEIVAQLEGKAQPELQSPLEELALQWEAVQEITLPDGHTIAIQPSVLIAQLRANPANPKQIRQSLQVLQQAQQTSTSSLDENDAKSVESILSRPEFQWQQAKPSFLQEWGKRFITWLNELLNKLFGGQEIGSGTSVPTSGLFSVFATVVFAALVFFVLRDLFAGLVIESRLAGEAESGEEPLTAETALRRAQDLSHGGDYRSAVRFLYISSLLLLEERGLLHYDRSKTNHEVLQSVTGQPGLKQPLQNVVEVFDQVWYGYQALDQEDYEQYEANVQKIKEQRS